MNAKFIPSANRKCRTRMMKSADLLNTRHPDDRNVYTTNIRTTNILQQTSYNTLEHTTTNLHYTANMLQQRKENQKLKHNQ